LGDGQSLALETVTKINKKKTNTKFNTTKLTKTHKKTSHLSYPGFVASNGSWPGNEVV